MTERTVDSKLLERPYAPPALFIFEEVEIGGGYHTLHACSANAERGWSEPYKKSSVVQYRNRIVRVPYPPDALSVTAARGIQAESILRCRDHGGCGFMVDCIDCHVGTPKVSGTGSEREGA
ncbi:MAG TPA: hypothetical protein VII30_08255 [Gemmatimonadaceae bacterium]